MKKKIAAIIMVVILALGLFTVMSKATDLNTATNSADLKNDATVNLVEIKDKELETLQDYQESYGDNTYGLVAYILNIIRLYSIPFGFVGIAISGIYRYIIGIRKLDVRDKGFGAMIVIISL